MNHLLEQTRDLTTRAGSQLRAGARHVTDWVTATWRRHIDRLRTDPTYRSAVMAGIAALVSAVLPHASVAEAFTRLIDDLLPDRRATPWSPPETPWGPVDQY